MLKLIAFILSFLSFFAFWNLNAQPNWIPETRSYVGEVPDKYGIWPTEEFTQGKPCRLVPGAFEAFYGLKGLLDNGSKTDALLILHKGRLVYENYADGWDADTPHPMYSVTKSVVATLVGIAIHEGYITGTDQRVGRFIGERDPLMITRLNVEYLEVLTFEHLLTMTSGYQECSYDPFSIVFRSQPGTRYNYSSSAITLLGYIVSRAVGQPLLDYAREKLFEPLGMDSVRWAVSEEGIPLGGYGIDMTPRDMLRLGYLYLNYGRWEDKQIFDPDWAAQAGPKSMSVQAYGHTFWNNELLPFFGFYEADGYAGQFISIYPAWDLVVARTGSQGRFDELAYALGERLGLT